MSRCKHSTFHHEMKLNWLDVRVGASMSKDLVLVLKITCAECKQPFVFKGDAGWSTSGPTTSLGGTELRAPMLHPFNGDVILDTDKVTN